MACPCFVPVNRWDERDMVPARYYPLGDLYHGMCSAGGREVAPGADAEVQWCNMGYARGQCPQCPAAGPDAVRFAVVRETASGTEVRYAIEKDHLPFASGSTIWNNGPDTPLAAALHAQMAAYVASYRRRRQIQCDTPHHESENRQGISVSTIRAGAAE